MEEEDNHSHLQPLIPYYSTLSFSSHSLQQHFADKNAKHFTSDSNNIVLRILSILLLALISLWANYEASKTFHITVVNDAKDSPAGRRFALSYVSNDEASRILLNTSSYVEHFLYPNSNNNDSNYPKKHIDSVTLQLPRRNLNVTDIVAVYTAAGNHLQRGGGKCFSYVIEISPTLLEDQRYDKIAIVGAILRGMARVWIWDGRVCGGGDRVPPRDGGRRWQDEGMWHGEGGGGGWWWWWEDTDPTHVARLLHYIL